MKQYEYMKKVADYNYERYLRQGYATAGHNGPHGHLDTPVRNTAHYLVIYSYLFKITGEDKYKKISEIFADYLISEQKKSKSGAIQCMVTDKFDHLNGLIGQGWVIEALLYYHETFHDKACIEVAKSIFFAQQYDFSKHLWNRIELDGTNIGIDPTYNHNIWFAACSYKLNDYCEGNEVDTIVRDLLTKGAERDFRVYVNGLLHHHVNLSEEPAIKAARKKIRIKYLLTPLRFVNPKKLSPHYMEYAYHIFDMYGFCILKERYADLPLFKSERFNKAQVLACNIELINKRCHAGSTKDFNVYSYSYNSPAFEWPFVSKVLGFENNETNDDLYAIQERLMKDDKDGFFTRNNPDIELWNARTYEIIRFLEN